MEPEALSPTESEGYEGLEEISSQAEDPEPPLAIEDVQQELRRLRDEVDLSTSILKAMIQHGISTELGAIDLESVFQELRAHSPAERQTAADRMLIAIHGYTAHDLWVRISDLRREFREFTTEFWVAAAAGLLASVPAARIRRYLPFSLYLEQEVLLDYDQGLRFESIISRISDALGFRRLITLEAHQGSWFSRWIARSRDFLSQPEVEERLGRLERAAELEILHKRQAQVDQVLAAAVGELLRACETQPNAVLQVGSMLVVKITDQRGVARLGVRTLPPDEAAELERSKDLLLSPADLWKFVASGVTADVESVTREPRAEPSGA